MISILVEVSVALICASGTRGVPYAPITVMPHPPRLVVGRDYEVDLTSAACLLGGVFALCGEFLLYICTFV